MNVEWNTIRQGLLAEAACGFDTRTIACRGTINLVTAVYGFLVHGRLTDVLQPDRIPGRGWSYGEGFLGGEPHWRENGTFWVDYDGAKRVREVAFPDRDSFDYLLEGAASEQRVCFDDRGAAL